MTNTDLVLEGGGVKGLGLLGAIERLMRAGCSFQRVGGRVRSGLMGGV